MVGVPEFSRVMNRTDHNQAAPKTSENRRKATKLQPTADESDAKDPVGEWVTPEGHSPKFSLCLWKSGDARGEFESKDLSIYLDGSWKLIPDGRWKGYVTFSGMVEYWAVGGNDVTPKAEKFEFLLGPEPDRLIHVKSSFLTNKNGNKWFPSGERSDNDPNLIRQNNNRPDFREPGN